MPWIDIWIFRLHYACLDLCQFPNFSRILYAPICFFQQLDINSFSVIHNVSQFSGWLRVPHGTFDVRILFFKLVIFQLFSTFEILWASTWKGKQLKSSSCCWRVVIGYSSVVNTWLILSALSTTNFNLHKSKNDKNSIETMTLSDI